MSRRFVAATQTALGELLPADLSGMNLEVFRVGGCTLPSRAASSRSPITLDGTKVGCRWWRA